MKKIILGYLLITISTVATAQTITGKVISSENKKPVPSATIRLKRSNKTTLANRQGEFTIDKPIGSATDTVLISSIGFLTLRVATNNLPNNGLFILNSDEQTLKEVGINAGKKVYKTINPFDYAVAAYTIQKDTAQSFITSKFPIAKAFLADVDSFKLEEIHLGRYVEKLLPNEPVRLDGITTNINTRELIYDLKKHVETAVFNLYVIETDSAGKPIPLDEAKKIPISLSEANSDTEINLSSYNIRPKHRLFYIAVEWLPILANQNYSWGKRGDPRLSRQMTLPTNKELKNDGSPDMAMVFEIGYEPYITLYNTLTQEIKPKYVWIEHKWQLVNTNLQAKYEKELALSGKISYYTK